MKVLLRAPLLTMSGYGVHSRQVARWLFENSAKYDLDITTELLNWGATPWITDVTSNDGLIGEMIQASSNTKPFYDTTIQLQLPNEWNPNLGSFNIGITAGVEADICSPVWIDCINKMDLVVVPSEFTKAAFVKTAETLGKKLITDIQVIPESFPDTILEKELPALDCKFETDFNFLVFGQITGQNPENDRKNIFYTFKWFSEAFAGNPNVGLVFKTNAGRLTKLDRAIVRNIFEKLMSDLKIPENGPKFYLLHGDMNDKEVASLYRHPQIKALLTLSHGEGFCGLDYTPILTENGIKRLDSVATGEKVLTHSGNWKSVTQTLSREYNGNMIKIVPYNSFIDPIVLTPNHNVYFYDPTTNSYYWKQAEKITKNDFLCLPIPKRERNLNSIKIFDYLADKNNLKIDENRVDFKVSNGKGIVIENNVELDKDFGRLVGYYFSEGCSSNGQIIFSLNKNEKETLARDIISLMKSKFQIENYSVKEFEDNNKLLVYFNSEILCNFFKQICGAGARNKILNSVLANEANHLFIEGFLTGVLLGDGYLSDKEISLELGSKEGIRQIRSLLLEKKILCSSNSQRRIGEIKGTKYDNEYYRLRISNIDSYNLMAHVFNSHSPIVKIQSKDESCKQRGKQKYFIHENNIILSVKVIETHNHNGKVYNLSVEDDESYCTENFVVHNCLPALEAAASGLPIIATDWSAHTEFLNLGKYIKVESELKEVHQSRVDNIFPKGSKWAYPKETDAKMRMLKYTLNQKIPLEWAQDLKEKIQKAYSFETISKYYDKLFEGIVK